LPIGGPAQRSQTAVEAVDDIGRVFSGNPEKRPDQGSVVQPVESPAGFPEMLQGEARRRLNQRLQEDGPPSERDIGGADA